MSEPVTPPDDAALRVARDDDAIDKVARHLWEYGCSAGMSKENDALMIGHFQDSIGTLLTERERELRESLARVLQAYKADARLRDDYYEQIVAQAKEILGD